MKPQQKTLTLWIVVILLMALVAKLATVNKNATKLSLMSAFLVSCDDKKMEDPFAGIDVQKGLKEYPYSTTEFLNLAKMTADRLHPLNSTETKHWKNIWLQELHH
jgi:hypothetical protein